MDLSTLSSYTTINALKCTIKAAIDFNLKIFKGFVEYDISSTKDEIVLDTSFLKIKNVEFNSNKLKFKLGERQSFRGSPLYIFGVKKNTVGTLKIEFETTSKCTGLQFLAKEQTLGKKHPFMYSQCEPIHARSIFPCFDTPSVKMPFDFEITSEYPVLVSGIEVGNNKFHQKVPIPSYLFAIASGNLKAKRIGPRSHVHAEPEIVDACQWEFEEDVEKQLRAAEELVFPYEWGQYDVLNLPPSFCFGGMENPVNTFATPTLIAGDRTLVNVIAHELAHSWSGNLVTNKNWSHFWLNEGWTVYLERRILGKLHGEAYRNFAAIEGWHDLESAVKSQPPQFTKLVVDLTANQDPDDAFSSVPYEKGSTFLWYLEKHFGKDEFDKFIKVYFTKFKYKSLDTNEFIETLYENFNKDKVDKIDFDLWLHTPGLPPKPDFDQTLAVPCSTLASKWISKENIEQRQWVHWASSNDVKDMNPLQIVVFLNLMNTSVEYTGQHNKNLSDAIHAMGNMYNLTKTQNAEIKFRWLQLAVKAEIDGAKQQLADAVAKVGRMKFVRPGYVLLNKVDRELALKTFKENIGFYHAICRAMVEKDLDVNWTFVNTHENTHE